MAAGNSPSPDRRGHVRFAACELNGLRGARVKYGQPIDVIDLSAGGVLFETAATLTRETTIVLEFSGPTKSVLIPSRVVRCRSVSSPGAATRTQGACAFKRPLGLKDLVVGVAADSRATSPDDEDSVAGAWQPVIGKYRDGRLISGYTNDFSPAKSHLHVSSSPKAAQRQFLELTELDAIFFLREAIDTANAGRAGDGAAPYGRKVALMLPSGEQLTGSTLNYNRHASGVFVYPSDSDFGVARVFVTQSGIHNLRLL
jgi:hypothetical protein